MDKDFGLDIIARADEVIRKTEELLSKNEVDCANYLSKFFETGSIGYFNNYKAIFDKLDDKGKLRVQQLFIQYTNSKYLDKKENKVKVKNKIKND